MDARRPDARRRVLPREEVGEVPHERPATRVALCSAGDVMNNAPRLRCPTLSNLPVEVGQQKTAVSSGVPLRCPTVQPVQPTLKPICERGRSAKHTFSYMGLGAGSKGWTGRTVQPNPLKTKRGFCPTCNSKVGQGWTRLGSSFPTMPTGPPSATPAQQCRAATASSAKNRAVAALAQKILFGDPMAFATLPMAAPQASGPSIITVPQGGPA